MRNIPSIAERALEGASVLMAQHVPRQVALGDKEASAQVARDIARRALYVRVHGTHVDAQGRGSLKHFAAHLAGHQLRAVHYLHVRIERFGRLGGIWAAIVRAFKGSAQVVRLHVVGERHLVGERHAAHRAQEAVRPRFAVRMLVQLQLIFPGEASVAHTASVLRRRLVLYIQGLNLALQN